MQLQQTGLKIVPCVRYLSAEVNTYRNAAQNLTQGDMEPKMGTRTEGISMELGLLSNLGICTRIFLMNNGTPNEPIQH
eukprot:s1970_g27.t1